MHIIVESLLVVVLSLYSILEAVFLFFVPFSMRRKSVKGERVLITGSGSGLGRGLATRFAERGAIVILVDVNKQGIEETRELIERGSQAVVHHYHCDLSDREQVYKTMEKVRTEVGEVDILINNAGIVSGKKILDCPDELMIKTMQVNVMAHFWTVKSVLRGMLRRDHGHIVTIASCAGLVGVNGLADYCASKFAAVGFDESIRQELDSLGKTGVHTTVVNPYYIQTGMFRGIVTRFPSILPFLEPEYVIDRIMDGVLCNQAFVAVPRVLYLILACKNILPVKTIGLLQNFLGVNHSMDEFKGRNKDE